MNGIAVWGFIPAGYPWAGEEPIMRDLVRMHGRAGERFLIHAE